MSLIQPNPECSAMAKSRSKANLRTEVQERIVSHPSPSHEIECPRCHDIMTLHSEFDRLSYICEECDFLLYFN